MTSAEKFEILSAYLDDEASQEERRLVEQWIECDPLFRQQYHAQLTLKSAILSLSASLFDIAIAAEDRMADNPTTPNQTEAEQSAYLRNLDDLKPDRFSIRTGLPMGSTAIISRWKDLLVIATALSATALTTLSYSSIRRSQEGQIRRPPGRITQIR